MKKNQVGQKIKKIGNELKDILINAAKKSNLDIVISGRSSLLSYSLNVPNWPLALTFIIITMLKKGILSNDRIYANYCHTAIAKKKFKIAINETFEELSKKINSGKLKEAVPLGIKKTGFNKVYK